MKNVLVAGATSAIAIETCRQWAVEKVSFFLIGRNDDRLGAVAQDLRVRGAGDVFTYAADLTDVSQHERILEEARRSLGQIDVALLAFGVLGDQQAQQHDARAAAAALEVNLVAPVRLLTGLADIMERQGRGVLAVISSVAGDRGRQSNYVYGCAKGGLSIFLQGLRNRLWSKGVRVLTIKPGFVDTPMTRDFPKGPLFVPPQVVARGIHGAVARGADVVYLPWFWRFIMLVIRHIPELIFKRMRL